MYKQKRTNANALYKNEIYICIKQMRFILHFYILQLYRQGYDYSKTFVFPCI